MADLIKIVLPREQKEKKPTAESTEATAPSTETPSETESGALSSEDVLKATKKVLAVTGIRQMASQVLNYGLSTVSIRTGAAEYEEQLNFAYSQGSKAVTGVTSIVMGAATLGAAGAAMAAATVGFSYLSQFLGYGLNQQKINLKQQVEDVSLAMSSTRIGVSGRRS